MYRRPSRPGRRATVDRAERPFDGLLRFAASRLPANQRMEPTEPDVFPSARSLGRRLIRTLDIACVVSQNSSAREPVTRSGGQICLRVVENYQLAVRIEDSTLAGPDLAAIQTMARSN